MTEERHSTSPQETLEAEHLLMIADDLGLQGKMLKAVDPSQVESKVLGKSHRWYWFVSRLDTEGNIHHAIVTDAAATAATAQFFSQTADRLAASDPKVAETARDIARNLSGER